jgi:hypothetical protein
MNDDFIYKALPKIPASFAESLYARISTSPHSQSSTVRRRLRLWQVASMILSLVLVIAWIQVVVRFRYVPIGDLWLVELSHPTQSTSIDQLPLGFIPTPGPTVDIADNLRVTRLKFLAPAWIPAGFVATELPETVYDGTMGMWGNSTQEKIRLFFVGRPGGMHPYAPVGMYEEVRVNGQPAVLIYGRLALADPKNPTAQRKWDRTLGLQLYWILDETSYYYVLETFGSYLSERDLIRMAESMIINPQWTSTPP